MLDLSRQERFLILAFLIFGTLCISFSHRQKAISELETVDFEEPRYVVNINTAIIDELERLPGIGPVMARQIISHRDTSGGFKTKEGLKDVKGIGEKKFEKLRDLIIISE